MSSRADRKRTQRRRSKRPTPKAAAAATVPVDDPRQRWRELAEEQELPRERGAPIGVTTGDGAAKRFAELRLQGLAAAQAMVPVQEMGLAPVTPGASNWIELGPTAIPNGQTYGGARVIVTGRVTEIVQHPTDPSILYVGTARGGIWKSEDGGVTWTPKSDNEVSLAIGALACAPSNPQVLYAGTGEGNIFFYTSQFPLSSLNATYNGAGILKSTNGGNSWTLQGTPAFVGACFYRIAVDPTDPNIAFAATNLGLYRTKNGGGTWTQLGGGLPAISGSVLACTDIVVDPVDHKVAYAAFWGSGIYKTTNANAGSPTWTKLGGGLPTTNLSRIALAISPTAPANVFALIADGSDALGGFYASANGGGAWAAVAAAAGVVDVFGAYTLNVAVDVSTPDIVYLSGVELYKAVRSAGTWTVTNIGGGIHPDNHAFASHPTNHLIVYAGSDGGIYKSTNGGTSWSDLINEGLAITQFEFIGQHPTSDAYVIGGTQDNGTEIFRNHPVFYHSDDGDGGMAGVDDANPRNVIHTYYNPTPRRSMQGGKFGSYASIQGGLAGTSLFYPPFAYDATNSQNLAFGTNQINLDAAQGTGGWPVKVTLPGISGRVSAITYPNANLIYAGTSSGQVYRLVRSGGTWTATLISAAPLPGRWVWDIATRPGDLNTVLLVVGGFGTGHVWRGSVAAGGASATWTDISGSAPNRVPDVPVNSLQVDPLNPNHLYVGSDIGAFRTTNGGTVWELFSNGLPNTAVFDLRLHSPTRLLRAATHGRGLWERKLDVVSLPDVDVYVRDHRMSTGRIIPTPAPIVATLEDPLQHVSLGDSLWWWMCADVKVDAPAPVTHSYQLPVSAVDYFAFETKLAHRNPQRGVLNRVYVHVSNRGVETAASVTVKILYADASPGLPNLPANFWSAFPGNGTTTVWKPIGTAKTITNLSPKRPQVLEWDWTPPASAATHSCLLVVVEPAQDPIPAANKVFNVATLVTNEKRVGLKNLHVIDAPATPWWFDLLIYARAGDVLRFAPSAAGWAISLLLPPAVGQRARVVGLEPATPTKAQLDALSKFLGRKPKAAETKHFFALADARKGARIENLPTAAKGFPLLLACQPRQRAASGSLTVAQERGKRLLGGNTFVLRRASRR